MLVEKASLLLTVDEVAAIRLRFTGTQIAMLAVDWLTMEGERWTT